MAEHFLPELNISEDSQDADIKTLLKIIKPSWNLDQLQIKIISGGYSNKMFRCHEESNSEDSVTVRFHHLTEKFKNPMELKVVQHLSTIGHFPKIHAIFANGYCYQFIKGETMINFQEKTGQVDDTMLRAIADEMAFVHSLKTDDFEKESLGSFYFFDVFLNYLNPETQLDYGLNKNGLLKEKDLISNFFKNKSCERVLCHGDSHPGNYVWDEHEGKVTFVDWEGTHIGYPFSEIAQFFVTMHFAGDVFSKQKSMKIIEDGYQEKFVRLYLEAKRKLDKDNTEVTENDVAQCMEEIDIFHLIPLLLFVSVSLIYPDITMDFAGDLSQVDDIIKEYLKLKKKVFGKESFETE